MQSNFLICLDGFSNQVSLCLSFDGCHRATPLEHLFEDMNVEQSVFSFTACLEVVGKEIICII